MLVALLLVSSGCATYHVGARSLFPPDVETVYVPLFESATYRPFFGERLTEAVVKRIEQVTPYKVVGNPDLADSILSGRLVSDTKSVVVENENDEPREVEVTLLAEVSWVNRRGDAIRQMQPIPVAPQQIALQQTAELVPEGGQSVATAQQKAIEGLAAQIVAMMETPW